MNPYIVYLDGVEFTDVEVKELISKLGRDVKEKGFTKAYDQKIRIFRAAYTYVYDLFIASGGCGFVEIEVQKECGGSYEVVTSGYIMLNKVVFEEYHCIATVEIDDNTVNGIFVKNRNKKINLDLIKTPNGTAVPSIIKPLQYFFNSAGSYLAETDGVDYAYGYSLFNLFDHILRQISNDELRFASDFFSTERKDAEWDIELTDLVVGEIVTISFDTEYGDTVIFEVEFSDQTSFRAYLSATIDTQLGFYATTSYVGTTVGFNIVSNGKKGTLNSVTTDGSATVFTSVEQAYVEGGAHLYISNGNRLSNDTDTLFLLSFTDVYEIVNNLFDLSYYITEISGQWYLKMEPIEDILTNAVALDVGIVNVQETKSIEDRVAGALMLGTDYGYNIDSATYKFKNLNCGDNIDRRIPSNVHTSFVAIIAQITGTEDFGDDLFLIEGVGNVGAYDVPKRYTVGEFPSGDFSDYNVWINNTDAILRYHLFFLPDAIERQLITKTIAIDAAAVETITTVNKAQNYIGYPLQYLTLQYFESALTLTNYKSISGVTLIKFYSGTAPTEARYGYFQDITYPVKNGITEFSLIVK